MSIYSRSDQGVLSMIGDFIKETRLEQNKTQQNLADAAGINRITLGKIESGSGGTLQSIVQILRALNRLEFLADFEYKPKMSPIKLAEMQAEKRIRASWQKSKTKGNSTW